MSLENIIGDYKAFFAQQLRDVKTAGFDLGPLPVSHLAYRTKTKEEYLEKRGALEAIASANVENVWRGRPMSKIILKEPAVLDADHTTEMIELIPPKHLFDYPMGLEHVGFVIGETFDAFCEKNKDKFSTIQDHGKYCQPHFVIFESGYAVKFYRDGLKEVVTMEGRTFDGFYHDEWPTEA